MTTALITREYNDNVFHFREDGYFNMTKAAKALGKRLQDFMDNQETKEYMQHLAVAVNSANQRDLTEAKRGNGGGTWGHPRLAVFYAQENLVTGIQGTKAQKAR